MEDYIEGKADETPIKLIRYIATITKTRCLQLAQVFRVICDLLVTNPCISPFKQHQHICTSTTCVSTKISDLIAILSVVCLVYICLLGSWIDTMFSNPVLTFALISHSKLYSSLIFSDYVGCNTFILARLLDKNATNQQHSIGQQ